MAAPTTPRFGDARGTGALSPEPQRKGTGKGSGGKNDTGKKFGAELVAPVFHSCLDNGMRTCSEEQKLAFSDFSFEAEKA